jgi:uncharacterized GH25 family protein
MKTLCSLVLALLISVPSMGHDMFLVLQDHDVAAHAEVTVELFNGTFDKSENSIDRERMLDVSVVDGEGETTHPVVDQWREADNITYLDFTTGDPGTYIVGVSTAANMIELSADDFNEYLQHDGVLDVLAARERDGSMQQPAKERYAKHVKTILQVGDMPTDSYLQVLGYPTEIIPQTNPADLTVGDTLRVLVLAEGQPVDSQLVYASHAGFHAHEASGGHQEAVETRTDDRGIAEIAISHSGRWYVRLIRMVPVNEGGVDYESNWATLTFEVR